MPLRTVNERQLEVLRLIADGDPKGLLNNDNYKTSAAALRTRRLVKISRGKGTWKATITPAGKYFLEHQRYPDGHWPEEEKERGAKPSPKPPWPQRGDVVIGLPPVEQLVKDLTDAGGKLTVTTHTRDYWQNLATNAVRHGKAPAGHILKVDSTKPWGTYIITAEKLPEWVPETATPIALPGTRQRTHPALRNLTDGSPRLPTKRATRNRALRILSALATEADERGYTVASPSERERTRDLLTITIHAHALGIAIDEQDDRTPHIPTKTELRDAERHYWRRIPEYDYTPSGRLTIRITTGRLVKQDKYGDGKRQALEDRLGDVLHEMELRAGVAELERLERERKAQEHQRRWQTAYDQAVLTARETHRSQVLAQQERAWKQARDLTEYLDALEQHTRTLTGAEQAAAREWLTWARHHTQALNPLNTPLGVPEDPEYTPEQLKPHMNGYPPYPPGEEPRHRW